ncbi:hypothetical protein ACFOYW_18360 [Gryllotalpicola reticulitermitis]|uniref:Lipoprotein n=1 Tax=Gryllotalpicola reticulitermitis TaxID=1184153 RepID=A0ABV8QCY9_9MICO
MSEHITNRTDILRDSKEKLLRRGLQISSVIALSTIALAGCASSHAAAEPKPTQTKSAQASPKPTATPFVEPTPTVNADPLPDSLKQLQADTLEQFDAEPWDQKLAYMTWLENQNGYTPQEAAREAVILAPTFPSGFITDPLTVAPYPTVAPTNTPAEIMTVDDYVSDVVYTQNNLLDAEKMLDADLVNGTRSPSWSYSEGILEKQQWTDPGDDEKGVLIEFAGTTTTVDNVTGPETLPNGDIVETINWHGTATSGDGLTTVPTSGPSTFEYHTFKDYKGDTESGWFAK